MRISDWSSDVCSSDLTAGGAPVFVWPGGGITYMVDVARMPDNSFGYVPTPALVAPIEFTLRRDDYAALGGHMDYVVQLDDVLQGGRLSRQSQPADNPWPAIGRASCRERGCQYV